MVGVRLVNLVKRYGSTEAVKGVSLDVKSGDFVVLLGPSGCGKTTTLRCISGLETPDSGEIYIGDQLANNLLPKSRNVAMVFQNYALYPHMTVYKNVAFPLEISKRPKSEIEKRVNEVAKLLDISKLLQRKPRQLSGGEQQRVALARAIVRQPAVFLMDEPLSNLDAKLRLYTRAEIKRLQDELKVTTIYVTHDQAEAMSMADKVAVMHQGNLVQYEDPLTIYGRPASTFVAGFVGSPPMNLLDVSVIDSAPSMVLDAGPFKYKLPESLSAVLRNHMPSGRAILGIRPEDLRVSKDRLSETDFQTEVYVVEPLGANTVVDLKVGEGILKSSVQGAFSSPVGEKVWVGFSPNQIRLYDGKTQSLIL